MPAESDETITNIRVYPDGRLSVEEKVNFFLEATEEVIFFGVRLKQFAAYFTGRKDNDFKVYIDQLLEKGVHIKCYLLNPNSTLTQHYFEDRGIALEREKRSLMEMNIIIEDLRSIVETYEKQQLKGKLEISTYNHFPQGYFLVVDGATANAKMQFAPYLFGVARSESPVMEINLHEQETLFQKYWDSLQLLISDAKSILNKV